MQNTFHYKALVLDTANGVLYSSNGTAIDRHFAVL